MGSETGEGRTWTTLGEASGRVMAALASRVGRGRPAGAGGTASSPAGRCDGYGGTVEEKGAARPGGGSRAAQPVAREGSDRVHVHQPKPGRPVGMP
jgi:hypothetical protein